MSPSARRPGLQIGRYTLICLIGQGLVLLACTRAEVAHRFGEAEQAAAALEQASALAQELGGGPGSDVGREVARVTALMER